MLLRAKTSPAPLLAAGAAAIAALAYILAGSPAPSPMPAAAVAPLSLDAARATQGEREPRSYAYYPEQLAALSSLSSFAPVADPGRPAAGPVRDAGPESARPEPAALRQDSVARRRDPPRHAEPRAAAPRVAAPAPIAPAMIAPAMIAAPAPKDEWKIWGFAVPKPGWPDTKALRDKAAGWGEAAASLPDKALALGAGATRLWRAPEPARETPARAY